jgi:hypothetical protein
MTCKQAANVIENKLVVAINVCICRYEKLRDLKARRTSLCRANAKCCIVDEFLDEIAPQCMSNTHEMQQWLPQY